MTKENNFYPIFHFSCCLIDSYMLYYTTIPKNSGDLSKINFPELYDIIQRNMPGWWNWQTRKIQVLVGV